MSAEMQLVLGSSSKWRKQLLKDFGVGEFITASPDIDEKAIRDDDPAKLVVLLANAKMDALIDKFADTNSVIICSDQVIEVDGVIREKPESVEEAKEYLRSYSSGKPAICHVGVCVYNTKTKKRVDGHDKSVQYFKPMPDSFFDELIAKDDVMWCAGGFCVEQMGEYVGKREGELETVMGLCKQKTLELLDAVGF